MTLPGERLYSLYIATNIMNKYKYVGITSMLVKDRANAHRYEAYYSSCTSAFKKAIQEYGFQSFHFKEVLNGLTADEAVKAEKEYILKLRTFIGFDDCVGYNSSLGGEGVHSVNIEYNWISQFSPDGKLIKVHNSLRGAEAATGISRVGIANACDGKAISCGGFLWRRYRDTDASLIAPEVIGTERVIRSVTKFSLDGTRLESYKSLKDAANASNCNSSVIAKVCSGKLKSTGGFQWRYGIIAGDIEPLSREKSKSRQVQMLDLGGNVIGTYSSIREAAEQNGISVSYVSTAIQNGRAVMGRYFKALNNFRHTRGVIQVDLSGREVARYLSSSEAARACLLDRASIYNCCVGKSKTAGGYCWMYSDEE